MRDASRAALPFSGRLPLGARGTASVLMFASLLALAEVSTIAAQVVVSPPVITLVEPERFGSFTVENRSSVAQEVTVEFRFGYPASDSAGNLRMEYDDSAAAARFSMAPWVRAFPRRVLLGPGQRQLIRLTARPPEGLADGVYWTRLVTSSVPESAPVDSTPDGIAPRITFRLQQITTLLYRRGAVGTSVGIGPVTFHADSMQPYLIVPLARTGVAPFLGTVTLRVENSRGARVHEATESTAVYFSLVKRFALPPSLMAPGTYTAEVTLAAERPDASPEALFDMPPTSSRIRFIVP